MRARITAAVRRCHGQPVDGVPRWIVISAYAASLTVLPSCIWRVALGFGAPLGPVTEGNPADARGGLPEWMPMWLYPILLSLVSELFAFLAVGLVSRWGEIVPRWMPLFGGRRIPVLAAVIPAGLGATILTAVTLNWVTTFNTFTALDGTIRHLHGWKLAAFAVSYLPLVAWGPLLGIVTVAYYLRRTRHTAEATAGSRDRRGRQALAVGRPEPRARAGSDRRVDVRPARLVRADKHAQKHPRPGGDGDC